ncbi:hypothetical protein BJ912DRAFT_1151368 [Pholiota molesta]|nr:hypothetical protein BJ912DRAFT_1151368 [Pholiota molesta]
MSSATKKIFAKMRPTPPEQPPNPTSSAVDTTLELSKTVLTIVQDVSGVFINFPYVGAVASVIQQFLTIRNEIKANETLCHQIIDKVLRRSKSICDDLATIANSDAKERLIKLEGSLREYESELRAALDKLKRHQARNRWDKVVNRGLDELNETARRLDEFNLEFMVRILVDIKTELAAVADRVDKIEVTEPAAQQVSNETTHVLPPRPHLMVERDVQLKIALDILLGDEPSRIAILGGGGFGKTTLARTILHDPKIVERYKSRYFLSCEAFTGVDTLLAGIGSMLDMKASPTAMLASIRRTLETSTTLFCLDNFETPWEPSATRTKVEECLASIADIPNLSLVITTRGMQRPSKVAWSHPLLPPLSTVSSESARKIIQTICGPDHIIDEPTQNLLDAVDGIPLAITLISNLLRDGESSHSLWNRWLKQETKIVENGGDDRESNLNTSIAISVSSPRIKKDPGAIALLAALSLLPNGFPSTSVEQLGTYLGINDVHKAVHTLRAVALIKPNDTISSPRIQMLSPIRLFCLGFLSSDVSLELENVTNYYIGIFLWASNAVDDAECYAQVVPEIQNIHSVFQRVFKVGYSQDITRLITATSDLTRWSNYVGYLSQDTIQMALKSSVNLPIPHAECLISLARLYCTEGHHTKAETYFREAATLFKQAKDVDGEAQALECSGTVLYYLGQLNKSEVAFQTSLKLYTKTGNKWGKAKVCEGLGNLYRVQNQFLEAQAMLSDALEAYQQISNLIGQANIAQILSDFHFGSGNLVEAEKYATKALNTAKQANSATGEGNALQTLGQIHLALDRVPEARQALQQALIIFKQQNAPINQLNGIDDLAEVYIRSDQLSAAEALLTAASKVDLDVEQIPSILTKLGQLYICGNRLDKAETHLDDALQHCRRFDRKDQQAMVLAHLGTIYFKSDRLDEAEQVLKSIPDLGTWTDVKIHRLWALGDLYIIKGDLEDAQASLNAAMAGCKDWGEHPLSYQQGNILRSMGTLHVKRGRVDRAIRAFKRAREFHRKAQWVSEQATDLKRLGEAYKMLERAEEAGAAFREAEDLMESVHEARILKE